MLFTNREPNDKQLAGSKLQQTLQLVCLEKDLSLLHSQQDNCITAQVSDQ